MYISQQLDDLWLGQFKIGNVQSRKAQSRVNFPGNLFRKSEMHNPREFDLDAFYACRHEGEADLTRAVHDLSDGELQTLLVALLYEWRDRQADNMPKDIKKMM